MVKRISRGDIIGIDTMVFIYHLEDNLKFSNITEKLFDNIENGKYHAVTSIITILEILVKPKMEKNFQITSDYRDLLLTFPNLKFSQVDLQVSDIASTLRAKYKIKTPDAIQIATAISEKAKVFITDDEQLKKISDIDIILLSELENH
ncbi:MAG: PIN domain-containing protein [Candidatus Marinimicrobia bacterium]|nr:PIN domain-containing protein [Candidatus Neomarinimicrobiota bacterium]